MKKTGLNGKIHFFVTEYQWYGKFLQMFDEKTWYCINAWIHQANIFSFGNGDF